ncbi:ATP-binding protein [Patescibacteria group bacterium]
MGIILLITVVLVNLFVAGLVYRRSRFNKTNIYFAIMLLAMVGWSVVTFIEEESRNIEMVNLLVGLDFALAALLGFSFVQFAKNFPRQETGKTITAFYRLAPILVIFLLLFTPLIIKNVTFYSDGIRVESGNLYPLYAAILLLYIVYGIFILFKKRKIASGISKVQISYMLWGLSITSFVALLTNLILPQIAELGKEISRIGIYSFLIFSSFTAYAIVRHRLLDIRAIISRSIIYFLLVLFVSAAFSVIILMSTTLFTEVFGANTIIMSVIGALLIVIGLDPLKRWLSKATDAIFFKAKIDYQILSQQLSEIINKEYELHPLLRSVSMSLSEGLKLKHADILMLEKNGEYCSQMLAPNKKDLCLSEHSALIRYLKIKQHPSILESLEKRIEDTNNEAEKQELERSRHDFEMIDASLASPVFSEGRLSAVLTLGSKRSGDSFSAEELALLNVIGPQIATAIEKAKLFGEVKDFSETLKEKVDQATTELKDRNVSLVAVQRITKIITETLDFNKVNQSIVDSLANELDYIGAMLLYIEPETRRIHPAAVTETALTKKAIRLLPKPLYDYYSEIDKDTTLDGMAIKEKQIKIGNNMTEFFSPPVPRPIMATINKILGVKTVIAIPLYSEGKVIGVMDIASAKTRDQLSEREIEVLETVADQVGIVARNLNLFEKLKVTNRQLEEANMHLQQLDQAKTEFVSIASHQLRTPMTGIMGYLSMMTSGDFGKLEPKHSKILIDLLSESQRMIRLINLFLNVSKIEAGKFEIDLKQTDINEVIESQIKEVEKVADKKKIKIIYKKPKTKLPDITADEDKLKDVVLNLLDNAIKYTAKGSVTILAEKTDGFIHVTFKDTGVGIKPSDARELFNKFVRGSGIARIHPDGSGLGLFIAKKIIEGHGGMIWVESEGQNKGSTFQFKVPIKTLIDKNEAKEKIK